MVNFAGTLSHLASCILYGLPDNKTGIPSELLDRLGSSHGRASGPQVRHSWYDGLDELKGELDATVVIHSGYLSIMATRNVLQAP